MNKSELLTGDLIVINGDHYKDTDDRIVRVYKDTAGGDIISGATWFPLKDRSDDTLFGDIPPPNHFVWFEEVWRPNSNMNFKEQKPTRYTHTLIWKRVHKSEAEKELEKLMIRVEELKVIIAEEKNNGA